MTEQSVTSKEISPGIILHKFQQPGRHADEELIYIFQVELRKLNVLEFTADFSGSENITLEGKNGLVSVTTVEPFSKVVIAKLYLQKDWRLKSKFKFTMKPAPKEIQQKFLQPEINQLNHDIEVSLTTFKKIPISVMPITDVLKILGNNNIRFVDTEFPPNNDSIFNELIDPLTLDTLIHWRRPSDFVEIDESKGLKEPGLNFEEIQPLDIKEGTLGNGWFVSALASLSERPTLIERLFITRELNKQGIYRLKICKNGEWISITIDDFIPCYPLAGPVFSRSYGNDLWVLLLEKAYAKLHGNYFQLRGGFVNEALMDLTGCPSFYYPFGDERVQELIRSNEFWHLLTASDDEGYLICASAPGEDKWTESIEGEDEGSILQQGHSYTILQTKEHKGNRLVNMRNPWGNIEYEGEWSSNSKKWSPEIRDEINPMFEEDDGSFWMSYEELLQHFRSVSICKVRNWDEVRIKGKFVKVLDTDDPNMEVILSKWYYSIDIQERASVIFGVHQEDERVMGVALRRSYLDIGLVIFRRRQNGSLEYIQKKELEFERQTYMEITLDAGSYIILPRTTGCTLRKLTETKLEVFPLIVNGKLHEYVISAVTDIFRKFDMLLNRELTYVEFKAFYDCINKSISERDFASTILEKYASTQKGISLKGFLDFWKDSVLIYGEEAIWNWFDHLGYDRYLNSIRSRCFIFTIHSQVELSVTVRDAIQTDLDNRANIALIEKFGKEMEVKRGIRAYYTFEKLVHAYSYGVINDQEYPIEVILDCSGSKNMIFNSKNSIIKKRLDPGVMEFMLHAQALPTADNFVRSAKCTWQPSTS